MQEILGPEGYLPGTTDNYVANEVIVASPRAVYVWPFLKRHHGLADLLGNASDLRFHDGSGSELSAAPVSFHDPRFSGGGESDPFDFLRAVSFFTGVVRRRIEGCYRDVSLAVNLSHDQENRDYPSQPQGCGPWISSAILSQKAPATMCPFCFATVALASAGAATSGGLTILAVRKFYGRDRSAKNRINPGRSEKPQDPMKHPEVAVEKSVAAGVL